MVKNYKKKNKRVYKKRVYKSKKALNKVEVKQVKHLVKEAIKKDDEWGYINPAYQFTGALTPTDEMKFDPPSDPTDFVGNTAFRYYSNHGIVTEVDLSTYIGSSGIESREGLEINVRRVLLRLQCKANKNLAYKGQELRVYGILIPNESLGYLDPITQAPSFYNDLLKSIKSPGSTNTDIEADILAVRKTYQIKEMIRQKCALVNDGTELIGLNKDHSYMWNVNWPFSYKRTTDQATRFSPTDFRLFFIYKWGGFGQFLNPDIDTMPEFVLNVRLWYTT
ncbi:MAG TPA: hypothetical protein EYO58_07440 [Flavobacteriales bacterium]|nr:hypothetical protein [Flavobacteriales bacterium]